MTRGDEAPEVRSAPTATTERRTVHDLLAAARSELDRVDPAAAADRVRRGALLVDIRPAAQRASEGEVPGSLVLERNVLEWRLDPDSGAAIPEAATDLDVIVFCSEGYTSSLAAADLQKLGLRATDLDGGFHAWAAAGLPTAPTETPAGERVPARTSASA